MNKIKVIDLLNMISREEEVPKKIKIKQWENNWEDEDLEYELYSRLYEEDFELTDEVEILEEEKKIPEKLENEKRFYAYTRYEENKDEIDKVLYILKAINLAEEKIDNLNNSINSIIDYLKSKGDE